MDGDMDDPSARKYRLGDALCRLCSEKDETSWMPAQCLGFDGNSCDGNSFELKTHPQTGRPIRYGAGKGTFLCETCAKAFYWCPHGRRRSKCKECKASQICEHGRQRDTCKACKGSRTGPGEAVRRKGMLRWPGDVAKDWNRCLQGYTRETCCACAPREFPRFFSKD